jgi:hypothetical protein
MSEPNHKVLWDWIQYHEKKIIKLESEMAQVMAVSPLERRPKAIPEPIGNVPPVVSEPPKQQEIPPAVPVVAPSLPMQIKPIPQHLTPVKAESPVVLEVSKSVVLPIKEELPAPQPIAVKPVVIKSAQPFLTEEEFRFNAPAPEWKQPKTVQTSASLEERIGTTWLLRIGGVLVMLGTAWGAVRLESSMSAGMRVMLGFLLALLIGGFGSFIRSRNLWVGRAGIGIALALGYFVSFASHFIPRMDLGFSVPTFALGGMLIFAGAIIGLSERWRSEVIAGFGLFLGLIPALIASPDSKGFALLAIFGIGLTSGILLLRNGWITVSSVTQILLYGVYSLLASMDLHGITSSISPFILPTLLFQHLIFGAAFLKWSRPWLARERVLEQESETLPADFKPVSLPWGRTFDVLNTLGFLASVLAIAWMDAFSADSMGLWRNLHVLLAVAGTLELIRLCTPPCRDAVLGTFHLITCVTLFSAALAWGLGGSSESVALALCMLGLVGASLHAPQLRWCRVASLIPGGLAALSALDSLLSTPVLAWGTVGTPLLLLISALPLERLMGNRKIDEDWKQGLPLVKCLDHLRGLMGTVILILTFAIHLSHTWFHLVLLSFTGLLFLTFRYARASNWSSSTALSTLLFCLVSGVWMHSPEFYIATAYGSLALCLAWLSTFRNSTPLGYVTKVMMLITTVTTLIGVQWIAWNTHSVPVALQLLVPVVLLILSHERWKLALKHSEGEKVGFTVLGMFLWFLPLTTAFPEVSPLPLMGGLLILLLVGGWLLPSKSWLPGLSGSAILVFFLSAYSAIPLQTEILILLGLVVLLIFALIDLCQSREPLPGGKLLHGWIAVCTLVLLAKVGFAESLLWESAIPFLFAISAWGLYKVVSLVRPLPGLKDSSLTLMAGLSLGYSVIMGIAVDSAVTLIPSMVSLIILFAAWLLVWKDTAASESWQRVTVFGSTLLLGLWVFFQYFGLGYEMVLLSTLLFFGGQQSAVYLKRREEVLTTSVGSFLLVFIAALTLVGTPETIAVLTSLVLLPFFILMERPLGEKKEILVVRGFLLTAILFVGCVALSSGVLFPATFATATWGGFATLLLLAGFMAQEKMWRYAAISLYGLSILRLLTVDLANADMNARIVACLIIGVLMIGAAYLYSYLSKTFERQNN